MAIDLIRRNNCYNFVILERSSSVGGTWNDNKYPGSCCDGNYSEYNMWCAMLINFSLEHVVQLFL